MAKCILAVIFIAVTAGNSLAAVSPHLEGDTGCTMDCCQKGQMPEPESTGSAICCKVDCEQPAGIPATPPNSSTTTPHDRVYDVRAVSMTETVFYFQRTRFPSSPTRNLAGSSNRFLEIGTFLI